MKEKRCVELVDDKECGLLVMPVENKPNVYQCPKGHRSVFVPEPIEKRPHKRRRRLRRMNTMQPCNGYFINGMARMIHPFNPLLYPAGDVLKPGRLGSVIVITRFDLQSFTMTTKEVAEWFGF